MGKVAVAIELTSTERKDLESLARHRSTAQGLGRRARIVLAASERFENKAIVARLGVDAAVACVDPDKGRFSLRNRTLVQLAEKACADHPDWAIALAFRMADPIMSEGRSAHYETAAEWLGIAARAHAACGRSEEWGRRVEGLIAAHRRKYTLRPLLEALRHVIV